MVVIDKKEVEEEKRRVGARVFIQGIIPFNELLLAHGQSFFC